VSNVKAEVKGSSDLILKLGNMSDKSAVEVRKAINQGALMVKTDALRAIKKVSFGKKYMRKGKVMYRSIPGQAPNKMDGTLERNILVSTGKYDLGKTYYAEVRANVPYAEALEYGTVKMAARPFMGPAVEKNKQKIEELVKKAIAKGLLR